MKTITITQAEKPHDHNQLHDELIAAGVVPESVTSNPESGTTTLVLKDADEAAARSVIAAHVKKARPAPPNLKLLADDYRAAIMATNLPAAVKDALAVKLMRLIREVARGYQGETNGG